MWVLSSIFLRKKFIAKSKTIRNFTKCKENMLGELNGKRHC